jgi:hypothetical protein
MVRIEVNEKGVGGGGVGAKKSAEGYRENYAVKALTDRAILKALAELPADGTQRLVFGAEDWEKYGYKGETGGAAMQMMDRIFDTLEIPYVAGTISKGGVSEVKVIRYGEEFDPLKYATTRAGRPSYKVEIVDGKEVKVQDGIVDHEDSPEGLVACLHEWLEDIAEDELFTEDMIVKLGLDRKMGELGLLEEPETEEGEE